MMGGFDAGWEGGWGPFERLDLPGGAGVLGAAGCGRRGGRGDGEGREAEGREAPAARHGVFRDGAGAFRRGGLRGELGPAVGDPGVLWLLEPAAGHADDERAKAAAAAGRAFRRIAGVMM